MRLGVAVIVGTAVPGGRSEGARAWGLIPQPDEQTLTVFIPTVHAGRTLANLATNPRIAVTASLGGVSCRDGRGSS